MLSGLARGVANQVLEAGAAIDRRKDEVASALTREDREALKGCGVRTGRIAAYMPGLLKPAQSGLCLRLKALVENRPALAPPGSASFRTERGWTNELLGAAGYVRLGPRGVRADMAERLSWTLGQARKEANSSAFAVAPEHAALVGAPAEDFVEILKAMGMIPAERDKETNAVKLWRFASRKGQERKKQVQQTRAVEDSPFAALAASGNACCNKRIQTQETAQETQTEKAGCSQQLITNAQEETSDSAMAAALSAALGAQTESNETQAATQDSAEKVQMTQVSQFDEGPVENNALGSGTSTSKTENSEA